MLQFTELARILVDQAIPPDRDTAPATARLAIATAECFRTKLVFGAAALNLDWQAFAQEMPVSRRMNGHIVLMILGFCSFSRFWKAARIATTAK